MADYNLVWNYSITIEVKARNEDAAQEKADEIYEWMQLALVEEKTTPANIKKLFREATIENEDQSIEEI